MVNHEESIAARANGDEDAFEAELPPMAMGILRAAMLLFAKKGYAATSVREIVQEAQATNPMLYYYFNSKEGIFRHLLMLLSERMTAVLNGAFEQEAPFREQVRAMISGHFEMAKCDPTAIAFINAVVFGPRESWPVLQIVPKRDNFVRIVAKAFEEAVARGEFKPQATFSSHFLAEQLINHTNTSVMSTLKQAEYCVSPSERTRFVEMQTDDEAIERLVQFFFNGAGQIGEGHA